jgi:ion channel POLLUX/CASTOR
MKKHLSFKERWRYHFDRIMGKGTVPLIGLLSAVCAVIIIAASYITARYSNGTMSFKSAVWLSFTHIISAGILGHDKTDNKMLLAMMTIVTFFGVFVASILIGIITSAFGTKLRELKKGNSPIIEKKHTIILGFNDNIFVLVSQLIEANRNCRRSCIVILGTQTIETMKESLAQHITDRGTTEIIIRSVAAVNDSIFRMAHLETAKSVIINETDDMHVIKALLAVSCFLSENSTPGHEPHIVASIREKENLQAAQIAGSGKAHIVYIKDMLARIIAHTTRQQGFSRIFTDFFDFEGNEFYREHFPALAGLKFSDILCRFEDSVVIGIDRHGATGSGCVMMNPPMDTVISQDDLIIHFAADDNSSVPLAAEKKEMIQEQAIVRSRETKADVLHILILGENEMLPAILSELDHYLGDGSSVTLTVPQESPAGKAATALPLSHITVTCSPDTNGDHATISRLLEQQFSNVLILSDLSADPETADNKTVLQLLYLRDIADKTKKTFQITSEIRSAETQNIARVINVHDFIVGTNLTNLIMTQYAEDPSREDLFNDILDADGSEIYMKPARNYIQPGIPVTFYTVTRSAGARREIPLGYRHTTAAGESVITLNPHKSDFITFSENDQLVLVAED